MEHAYRSASFQTHQNPRSTTWTMHRYQTLWMPYFHSQWNNPSMNRWSLGYGDTDIQKYIKKIKAFLLGWPTISGHGLALGCDWYTYQDSIGENWFSLCKQVSTENSFPVRRKSLSLLLQCWDSIWLEPMKVLYELPQSLLAQMCTNPIVPERHCLLVIPTHHLCIMQSFCHLIQGWVFQSLSLSVHC